jgi:hypothetical protein
MSKYWPARKSALEGEVSTLQGQLAAEILTDLVGRCNLVTD